MKLFKRILKISIVGIGLIVITAMFTLWLDTQKTSYLKIKKNEPIFEDSYLITNVNIIPMYQDTLLNNKMVYIKDGIIAKIADTIQVDDVEILDEKRYFGQYKPDALFLAQQSYLHFMYVCKI